jgi:hypothetical protein
LFDTAQDLEPDLYYTDNPSHWIADDPNTLEEDTKIDVVRATKGKLRLERSQQDFISDGNLESFFYGGRYKGNEFQSEYLPEDFFNRTQGMPLEEKREQADGEALMRITNEIDPDDGIINGFIMAREEQNKLVFYLFIDEDWRTRTEFTNIVWGDDFRNQATLSERTFDTSTEEEGIYIEKLQTNVDWYKGAVVKGGIVVGEITKDTLQQHLAGETDATFMVVR